MRQKYSLMIYFCCILALGSTLSLEAGCCCNKKSATTAIAPVSQNGCDIVLYVNPKCPYCQKVTNYLKEQGRTIPTKNTQDPMVREELIRVGGKSQVPCLVIDGTALYESNDIIQWLKNHP